MIEKESHFPISRRALTIGVVGCLVGVLGTALAFVNEAISLAYEAATPYVEQGFEVREDSWSGEV